MNKIKKRIEIFLASIILLGVLGFFIRPVFEDNKKLVFSAQTHIINQNVPKSDFPERFEIPDDQALFIPYNNYIHKSYRRGIIPFWNFSIGTGDSIIGNVQSVLFDPFFIVTSLMSDSFYSSWSLRIILLNVIGVLFFIILLRALSVRTAGIILGGVFYITLTFYAQDFVITLSRTYFLGALISLHYLQERKQFKYATLLVVALALPFLSGDLQMAIHTWSSLFFIYIFSENKKSLWGLKFYWIWPLSLLLVSFNLIPIWSTIQASLRDHSVDLFSEGVRSLNWTIEWFSIYIGITGLVCVVSSLFSCKKYTKQLFWLSVVSLLYSIIQYFNQVIGILIPLAKSLQIANYFFIIPLTITLPLLIAIGLDRLIEVVRLKVKFKYCASFLVVVLSLGSIRCLDYSYKTSRDMFASKSEYLPPATLCIEKLKQIANDRRVLLFDYGAYDLPESFLLNYGVQSIGRNDSLFPEQYLTFLKVLKPEIYIEDFDNPLIKRFKDKAVVEDKNFQFLNTNFILSSKEISSNDWIEVTSGTGCIRQKPNFFIYKKKEMSNYVLFFDEVIFEKKNYIIEQKMREEFFPGKEIAYISGDDKKYLFNAQNIHVENVEKKNNSIVVNIKSDADGFLMISESYHSDWTVRIDGIKSKVFPVNINFLGTFIPKGAKEISFKFVPTNLYFGFVVTAFGVMLLLFGWFHKRKLGLS